MSCISFVNPTRHDVADAAACTTPLPFSSPRPSKYKQARLRAHSASQNVKIREAAAGHPDLPVEIMFDLVQHDVASVRSWVARNPSVPERILIYMQYDQDASIRAFVEWKLKNLGESLDNLESQGVR